MMPRWPSLFAVVAVAVGAKACVVPKPQPSSASAASAQVNESGPMVSEAPLPAVTTDAPLPDQHDPDTKQCPTLYLSPERLAKEAALLEDVRNEHALGMRAYGDGDCRHVAPPAFSTVMKLAFRHGRLFECREGSWTYRDTEIVHLYATATFYYALCSIRIGEDPGFPSNDELLCKAFHAAAQLVSQVAVPSEFAARVAAVREICVVPGGWRSDREPRYTDAGTGR
jgi:hypothetical protein